MEAAVKCISFEANRETGVKKYTRGGTISQDSGRNLKRQHPVAATNLTHIYNRLFTGEAMECGVDMKRELSVDVSGDI